MNKIAFYIKGEKWPAYLKAFIKTSQNEPWIQITNLLLGKNYKSEKVEVKTEIWHSTWLLGWDNFLEAQNTCLICSLIDP